MPVIAALPVLGLAGALGPSRAGVVVRVALVYGLVLACLRVLGKRELSQMTPFEFVALVLIPQLFRNAILQDDATLLTACVGATTLFTLVFATSVLSYRWTAVAAVVEPGPTVLFLHGAMIATACDQERVTRDDIESAAHRSGLSGLDDIDRAILEPDGRIAIIPRER